MGQWDLSLVRLAADPGSPQGGPCDRACLGVAWQGGAPTPGPGDGGPAQTLCPALISNRDSFKSNDQLARGLQR